MDRRRVVERKNRNEQALQKAIPTQDSVITSLFSPVVQLLGRRNSRENSTQTSALWQVEVTWGCLVKYYCTNRLEPTGLNCSRHLQFYPIGDNSKLRVSSRAYNGCTYFLRVLIGSLDSLRQSVLIC